VEAAAAAASAPSISGHLIELPGQRGEAAARGQV